jgi:hypothetical protein
LLVFDHFSSLSLSVPLSLFLSVSLSRAFIIIIISPHHLLCISDFALGISKLDVNSKVLLM